MLSAVYPCNISQCFIQSPLLFSLVECVSANTYAFGSVSRSQFCIEVSSNNSYVSFAICRVLLDRFEHFFDVMVRISRVGEGHTHQFDALAVYHDRGGDGPFVDVFGINSSLPPLLVQHNSNAVCVVVFSYSHEYVFVMHLPDF